VVICLDISFFRPHTPPLRSWTYMAKILSVHILVMFIESLFECINGCMRIHRDHLVQNIAVIHDSPTEEQQGRN